MYDILLHFLLKVLYLICKCTEYGMIQWYEMMYKQINVRIKWKDFKPISIMIIIKIIKNYLISIILVLIRILPNFFLLYHDEIGNKFSSEEEKRKRKKERKWSK